MTEADSRKSVRTYKIEKGTTGTEAPTLRDTTTGATCTVTELPDDAAKEFVLSLDSGRTVRLEVAPDDEIAGLLPAPMPDTYGSEYAVESCCM
jgi:hypothetical protein